MDVQVGDWVLYRATWLKDKEERLAVIVKVKSTYKLSLYGTADGYILTDEVIIEIRRNKEAQP